MNQRGFPGRTAQRLAWGKGCDSSLRLSWVQHSGMRIGVLVPCSIGVEEATVPRGLQSRQGLSDSLPGCFLPTWQGGWNISWPLLGSPAEIWG